MLDIDDIRVGYPVAGGFRVVVDALSLRLQAGEIGCLLGASGCGKTTVLRAIAGFEPVQAGRVSLGGEVLSTPQATRPPERRGVGLMFQDYALFPHLDVAGNIGFGLSGAGRAARAARIAELLALVGLPEATHAWPHELSGGQQQRVALARALAPAPRLVLLDEPFSNLDIDTRERLADELRAILKATGTTALLVTHDQAEAFAMADAIGVMEDGRIRQWGSAESLYRHPVDRFVAGFIGRGVLLPAAALGLPGDGDVLLRPEQLVADPRGAIHAEVLSTAFRGPGVVARLRLCGGEELEVDLPAEDVPAAGSRVALRICAQRLVAFPPQGEPA
ncbi:MAG: ABC transporter ATP-binding protein [Luteimonas sp.]|nr:ABC transporter ATP-binding protein [Luteimonas sp.]